jgi:hypothetical protein
VYLWAATTSQWSTYSATTITGWSGNVSQVSRNTAGTAKGGRSRQRSQPDEGWPQPIPTTTVVTASGVQVADERQRVDCPPDYPYVTPTFTFTGDADGDLSTTADQFPLQSWFLLYLVGNDPGVPNYTGFQFRLDPGMAWTAEVTCSTVPGQ